MPKQKSKKTNKRPRNKRRVMRTLYVEGKRTSKIITVPKKTITFRGSKMNLYDVYPTKGGAETSASYNREYNNPYFKDTETKIKQHIEPCKGGFALYTNKKTRELK